MAAASTKQLCTPLLLLLLLAGISASSQASRLPVSSSDDSAAGSSSRVGLVAGFAAGVRRMMQAVPLLVPLPRQPSPQQQAGDDNADDADDANAALVLGRSITRVSHELAADVMQVQDPACGPHRFVPCVTNVHLFSGH
jgi:hypothetical protein